MSQFRKLVDELLKLISQNVRVTDKDITAKGYEIYKYLKANKYEDRPTIELVQGHTYYFVRKEAIILLHYIGQSANGFREYHDFIIHANVYGTLSNEGYTLTLLDTRNLFTDLLEAVEYYQTLQMESVK